MHTEAHRDYIRPARHFIYISGTGGKDGSINRDILDYLLRLPTRNAHNTETYKDVINELKTSPEITRLVDYDNDHVHMVLDDKNQFSLFLKFWHSSQENDVMNLAPNFSFANMRYLMLLFERIFHKDLKTNTTIQSKRYNVPCIHADTYMTSGYNVNPVGL